LHRLLPLVNDEAGSQSASPTLTIAAAARPHPQMLAWLAEKTGSPPLPRAEMPGRMEIAARTLGVEIDPEQILLDCLAAKGFLKPADVPNLKSLRELIADPVQKWLLLQNK